MNNRKENGGDQKHENQTGKQQDVNNQKDQNNPK